MSSDDDSKQVKLISRRRFLPWVITGVAGIGFTFSVVRELLGSDAVPPAPKYAGTGLTPRFRKKTMLQALPHEPGFYLYSPTNVVRYFPESQTTRFTGDGTRLQPVDATQVSIKPPQANFHPSTVAKPRAVNRQLPPPGIAQARVSFAFEQEAVSEINAKNLQRAFDLLTSAIQRELQLEYARDSRLYDPSVRLCDLLAGLSVRFDRPDIRSRMIEQIKASKNQKARQVLDGRIKKWQDPQSRWYKRWSNHNKRIKWSVNGPAGLVLLM